MNRARPVASVSKNRDHALATRQALQEIDFPSLSGKTVLLKPNVGRESGPCMGINTNPAVVTTVFDFLDNVFDDTRFLLGDSPIISTDTVKAFHASGYDELVKNSRIEFVDLDEKPPVTLELPGGKIISSVRVSGYWEEVDYIVSIPVLKMHMHVGASLGFKNMKGLIYKRDKIKLHHQSNPAVVASFDGFPAPPKELDIAIADLARGMIPDLTVIDATWAQEGMGPSSGNRVKLDTVIASKDFLAADIVALAIARPSWRLHDVPHLEIISRQRAENTKTLGPVLASIDDIKTIPEDITPLIKEIAPPPKTITVQHANVRLIDIDSCSACLSTVMAFVTSNKEFLDEHFTPERPLNLAIGKGLGITDFYEPTYLIGNCTRDRMEDGVYINGCTPVQSSILQAIKDHMGIE